jgi:hypothetical protein
MGLPKRNIAGIDIVLGVFFFFDTVSIMPLRFLELWWQQTILDESFLGDEVV